MVTISQTKLSNLPKKCKVENQKPELLLEWDGMRLDLKKFVLLHLIIAVEDYRSPYDKLSVKRLVEELSRNMGGIVKFQVNIFVENLIYNGYLSESYLDGVVTLTDKVYTDLKDIDRLISGKNLKEKKDLEVGT